MTASAQAAASVASATTLDALERMSRLMARAWGDGILSDEEADELHAQIAARRAELTNRPATPMKALLPRVRRPRSPERAAAMARRRKTAASGALPPEIAAEFTTGEAAVLSVVGREAARAGRCDWEMDRIAALAGVCRTTARNALRLAQRLGLLRVQERRLSAERSLTNLVTVTGKRWWAWLKRQRERVQKAGTHEYPKSSRDAEKAAQTPREGTGGGGTVPRTEAPPGISPA